ncbi:MAG: hypothetical protein JWR79_827 [Tardiphaga sp.]|nr:hypothetical protein [Tardiphaga sp.]
MLYADDLSPGQEFVFGTWTMTQQDIIDYARQWDPLPIHIDIAAAAAGPHGGIIASGLHTLAIYQRLLVDAFWKNVHAVGGRNFQLKFKRPVRPGMTLSGHARIDRIEHRPERGNAVLYLVSHLTDDNNQVVFDIAADAVILRRPSA